MRIQICFINILIFTNSILVMNSLMTFSDEKYKRLEKFLEKKKNSGRQNQFVLTVRTKK